MNRLALLPAALFVALAAVFWAGLSGDPSRVPSVLIGKPVPDFALPGVASAPGLASADLKAGPVSVVNVWASWCAPCKGEHPLLVDLGKRGVALFGINQKDDPGDAARFLEALGQPFRRIGADRNGRVSLDWGVYGVPETFVVDGEGVIRYKHIGPLTAEAVERTLLPEIAKAGK